LRSTLAFHETHPNRISSQLLYSLLKTKTNRQTKNSKNYDGNHMGVSQNRGTPKWMVYNGKTLLKMDDFGGKPTIFGNTHMGTIWPHLI